MLVWNNRWCWIFLLHKTRLQISSEGTSRFCGRSLTLVFLVDIVFHGIGHSYIIHLKKGDNSCWFIKRSMFDNLFCFQENIFFESWKKYCYLLSKHICLHANRYVHWLNEGVKIQYLWWMLNNIHCIPDELNTPKNMFTFFDFSCLYKLQM